MSHPRNLFRTEPDQGPVSTVEECRPLRGPRAVTWVDCFGVERLMGVDGYSAHRGHSGWVLMCAGKFHDISPSLGVAEAWCLGVVR